MTRPTLFSAILVCALHLSGAVLAQSLPDNDDLRALRYYIEHNEVSAVRAEIQRLQIEFPSWTPPKNLSDLALVNPTDDVAEIYARLARGDVDGATRIMERTKARYPGWVPPKELATQLDLAAGQVAFDRAVNSRDTATAVRIGSKVPALFRCDRVINAWNLAELQAASGSKSRALAAYTQVVRTCKAIPELVATIEKAEAVATDAQLVALSDTAKSRFPRNALTFDALTKRLLAGRGRGAAPSVRAAPRTPNAAPKRQTSAPIVQAPTPPAPSQSAVPSYGGAKLASLPRSGDNRIGITRSAKESGNFPQCMANSARPRSMDVAYERAWCAYNLDRSLEALAYFSAAAQSGMGGEVPRDSRFGMTLSLLKRGMVDEAAKIASTTDLTLQQRKEVEVIILDQRGVTAFKSKQFRDSINYLDALEKIDGGLRRDLAMLRGYAYLRLGERTQAREQFQKLHDTLATTETRKALSSLQ